jgi:peptidoglycan/LPS O-acetylase OafA/YrhL
MSPSTTRPESHLPQLDALRGVACLMVLVAHLKGVRFLHWVPDIAGVAGVGIFFALSGFLITRILLADRAAGRGLMAFYNRRVARIFPIYYLTLGILAITWPGKELLWAANFSFNFQFLASSRDYFQNDAAASLPPVAHFWSLCVEEHFYWFWPVAVMILPRAGLRCLLVAIILGTPVVTYLLGDHLDAMGFAKPEIEGLLSRLTVTQLVAISIGALAAFHESWLTQAQTVIARLSLPRATLVGIVMVLAGALWAGVSSGFPGAVTRAAAGTSLHLICGGVFLVVFGSAMLGRLVGLSNVGKISFGLYLYHLPIYAALGLTNSRTEAKVLLGCVAFLTTCLCAALSYYLLELPIMTHVREWQKSGTSTVARYSACLGTSLTLLVTALFAANLAGSYGAFSPFASPVAGLESSQAPLPAESIRTIVVGSSHGEMGFAAPECQDLTYNVSLESQDLWYDCEIVKSQIGKMPNLQRVVFCVSVFSFRYSICDTDSERWREALYYHAAGIRSRADQGDERRYSPLVLANSAESVALLTGKMGFVDEPLRGWKPLPTQALDPSSGKAAAERHHKHGRDRVAENQAQLIRTIQACQRQGIECILVSIPTHQCYRDYLPADYRSETAVVIRNVQDKTGVRYLDYAADTRFLDRDFYDGDHLNKTGAVTAKCCAGDNLH